MVLNLIVPQATALHNNGWYLVADFEWYAMDGIKSCISSINCLAVNREGVAFPSTNAKRVYTLADWVNRKIICGVVVDPNKLTPTALTLALANYPTHGIQLDADNNVDKSDEFKYETWSDWQDSVVTFIKGKKAMKKDVPLYYVICKTPNPILPTNTTKEDENIYNAPHISVAFKADNKSVHVYLTNGTDAEQWTKQHTHTQDGKLAWRQLCNYYDGPAEVDKHITVVKSYINAHNYKNEASFSFEHYSTKLRKAFLTLDQYK